MHLSLLDTVLIAGFVNAGLYGFLPIEIVVEPALNPGHRQQLGVVVLGQPDGVGEGGVAAHALHRGQQAEADWNEKFAAYEQQYPELARELRLLIVGERTMCWLAFATGCAISLGLGDVVEAGNDPTGTWKWAIAPNGQVPANVRIDDHKPEYTGVGGICSIDSGLWLILAVYQWLVTGFMLKLHKAWGQRVGRWPEKKPPGDSV